MTVTGSHRSTEGLHSSREKGPMPSRAHAPMASRVEMTCRAMWPDSSARAPALAPPMCKCAPGMGWLTVNAAVHVWPMLVKSARARRSEAVKSEAIRNHVVVIDIINELRLKQSGTREIGQRNSWQTGPVHYKSCFSGCKAARRQCRTGTKTPGNTRKFSDWYCYQ